MQYCHNAIVITEYCEIRKYNLFKTKKKINKECNIKIYKNSNSELFYGSFYHFH